MEVKEKNMNYIFTKNGKRKTENFIQSCIEKRKKMINEGIDTGDLTDNAVNLNVKDILLSINYFHTSDLRKHTYSVLITDHFREELTLVYEADFIKCKKRSIIDDAINKEHLAKDIIDVFENLLDKKNIEIPCDDFVEEERHNGGNDTKLYGTEYFDLVAQVRELLY